MGATFNFTHSHDPQSAHFPREKLSLCVAFNDLPFKLVHANTKEYQDELAGNQAMQQRPSKSACASRR